MVEDTAQRCFGWSCSVVKISSWNSGPSPISWLKNVKFTGDAVGVGMAARRWRAVRVPKVSAGPGPVSRWTVKAQLFCNVRKRCAVSDRSGPSLPGVIGKLKSW